VKPSLLDTDTLSFFFKRHPSVVSSLEAYSRQYGRVNLSIITYYEILSGLKHRDANKKLEVFLDFAAQNTVLSLTEEAATIASEYYATLCKQGQPLEDIDLLIAGIALSNNLVWVNTQIAVDIFVWLPSKDRLYFVVCSYYLVTDIQRQNQRRL
jgi:tRNA(fMet)-specific endonuclease VapC